MKIMEIQENKLDGGLEVEIQECVDLAVSWLEDDWEESVIKAKAFEDYPTRYGIGSYGEHELAHTLYMMQENFEHFVLGHPSLTQNKEDYVFAQIINQMIAQLYQRIGTREEDKGELSESNESNESIE